MLSDSDPGCPKIIVLADDLSGAAEIAGIAFDYGLSAEVQRQFEPAATAQVISVDTDSRNLPSAGAAQCLRTISEQVIAARPGWIFKKVDSLLRGNVRVEIEAMLDVAGQRRAILIPANPSRGRVIAGGRYFVDGVPLDQTPFADDTNYPRLSADIDALLGDGGREPVHIIPMAAPLPATGILVPEVSSWSDIYRLARDTSSQTLVAGAADFFSALIDVRCQQRSITASSIQIAPPALLVCGSRASWAARRADCDDAGIPLITLADGGGVVRPFGALAIGIGERELTDSAAVLRSVLPQLISFTLNNSGVQTLLIEGGATAAAIAEHFGWTRFTVTARAPAGVGVLQPIGARAPLVVIKPGSYPWPREIWEKFRACHAYPPEA